METNATQTTTLRQAVEALGFDYDGMSQALWPAAQDVQVITRSAVDRDGRIFVHCGGEALIAFQPGRFGTLGSFTATARPFYLVRDDDAARTWDVRMRLDHGNEAIKACHAMGPRPSVHLKLVASG